MTLLQRAIEIAMTAHKDTFDKGGNEYILHPLRVMFRLHKETEMIVAVLHDIIEDTHWTFDMLRQEGFPPEVLSALECVTKRRRESYSAFIKRASSNDVSRRVKIADLEDNMDMRRLPSPTKRDFVRLAKYRNAWEALTSQRKP